MNNKILTHFQTVDQVLYSVAQKVTVPTLRISTNYFADLVETIISQQLSEKAAATIFERFCACFPNRVISPEAVLSIPDTTIRGAGISGAKTDFIKSLARQISDKSVTLDGLDRLSDAEVIQTITTLKGIGPWTAEMFLMFSLGREDVFSFGDLGLRRAIQKLYRFRKEPTRKRLEKLTRKWTPYRTYAALILWRSLSLQ